MQRSEFIEMLENLGACWRKKDYGQTSRYFSADVKYADPTRYAFANFQDLLAFFENDDGCEQVIDWHTIIFDEESQTGCAEYTYAGTHNYHGAAIIHLTNDKISHWREHQHIDLRNWQEFAGLTSFAQAAKD